MDKHKTLQSTKNFYKFPYQSAAGYALLYIICKSTRLGYICELAYILCIIYHF